MSSATRKTPTLEEVNSKLLSKLSLLIDQAESPDEVLALTESVSKLNASYRNNSQFNRPETDAEREEREQAEIFKQALGKTDIQEGEIV